MHGVCEPNATSSCLVSLQLLYSLKADSVLEVVAFGWTMSGALERKATSSTVSMEEWEFITVHTMKMPV